MKKLLTIAILLFSICICMRSQNVDEVMTNFSTIGCCKVESANEDEWKYAKYILSQITPSFYEMSSEEQLADSIANNSFYKVFTRDKDNAKNYSLDFSKVQAEAAKVNISEIPDVSEFSFIGMKIPLLEKARSITFLELEDCPIEVKSNFEEQIEQLKASYDVLIDLKSDDENVLMMKNKEPEPFTELIIVEFGKTPQLLKLKGTFDMSDISAPKDYNE